MMKYCKYLSVALLMLTLVGCGTSTNKRLYTADYTHFHILMNDLQFIGETEISKKIPTSEKSFVEISITYSTYLGFISDIQTVNGEVYNSTKKKTVRLDDRNIGSLGKLDKAAYKVMEQFPEARYYQVVSKQRVREKLFLGSHVTEKAVIRAYKFKK